jgi:hypothetical protein
MSLRIANIIQIGYQLASMTIKILRICEILMEEFADVI